MSILVNIGIICMGIVIIFAITRAIIQKKITESHGILWLLSAVAIVVVGFMPDLTIKLAKLLGVDYAPTIVFTFAILLLFYLVFRCTVWIAGLSMRIQELGMQVSMLNQENAEQQRRLELCRKGQITEDEEHFIRD